MSALHVPPAWAHLPFFSQSLPGIAAALAAEPREVLPATDRIFAALAGMPPDKVRAVILGQDPYPTPGHATGLAFSVPRDTRLPRSLANIFAEMEADLGARPASGDLSGWADQGVLLLNTVLTVPAGVARGHARLGWQRLAAQVLSELSARPTAFVLWGRDAQAFRPSIAPAQDRAQDHAQDQTRDRAQTRPPDTAHLIVESAHPSPLSAQRGFFGSRPFSRINAWLAARGEPPIAWTAPPA
ncbi:MAG: uracil-DNA glycosylase [Pseudomonadota bacterium]